MKLQEFVSETLREIIAGVKEAQTFAAANGSQINPREWGEATNRKLHARGPHNEAVPIREVDFDVAVTSTDTTEQEAGAGIFVAAFALGAKERADISNSSVSRIKFSVSVVLPQQLDK
jgi:hypothetical protein